MGGCKNVYLLKLEDDDHHIPDPSRSVAGVHNLKKYRLVKKLTPLGYKSRLARTLRSRALAIARWVLCNPRIQDKFFCNVNPDGTDESEVPKSLPSYIFGMCFGPAKARWRTGADGP
ncbi:hypothetical protein NPIL_424881 [Nephila pilipes]|uniref:Uncharacterized protein n=1 Tax=Nephila pilipes TaxID=299642 RepID=A0A8X6NYQ1_NEPPI|nr:hypothetical protein NPIL_424881 [Nephila pilipes]